MPASGFDDPRDSDAAQLWLGVAGVAGASSSEGAAREESTPAASRAARRPRRAEASPDEPAAKRVARRPRRSAPAASVDPTPTAPPSAPVSLDALLTRASDLPTPDLSRRTDGPTPLPWTTTDPSALEQPDTDAAGAGRPGGRKKKRSAGDVRTRTPRPEPEPADEPRVLGRSAEPSEESAKRRRTRRPGPAPLPEDPRERAEAAREVVLRQLAMGPRSRGQLERKLVEREAEPELIEAVLDRFEEVKLVDDAAFAEVWVRSRHRSRGLSRRAIGRELYEKGVDKEVAEEALEVIEPEDERAAALDLARRRLRGKAVPAADSPEGRAERDKVVRRLVGMLGRKGYGPGLAFGVVKEAIAELEG